MRYINHLRVVMLMMILLLIWMKKGGLLWVVGSRVTRRVIVVHYRLRRQLIGGRRKHARVGRVYQGVTSKQGAREYRAHFHQIKKGVSMRSWKWSVKRYGTETLVILIHLCILVVCTFNSDLVIGRRGKHLLNKKVVLHEDLLRLLHLWIDLDRRYIIWRRRAALRLWLAVACRLL